MSEAYAVPGVYVTESKGLSINIHSGETAVPVFVGIFNAKTPLAPDAPLACVRIESWLEFTAQFGSSDCLTVTLVDKKVHAVPYLGSYSVQMYFENGGGPCYILSVNDREKLNTDDIQASITSAISQCPDITLLCWCEFITPDIDKRVYTALAGLLGASSTSGGNRGTFLLTDAWVDGAAGQLPTQWTFKTPEVTETTQVAAYFPALMTGYTHDYASYVDSSVRITQFSEDQVKALASANVKDTAGKVVTAASIVSLSSLRALKSDQKVSAILKNVTDALSDGQNGVSSLTFQPIWLRASVAMAGVYARVDRERGVWKAPANVALSGVSGLQATGIHGRDVWMQPIRVDDALNATLVDAKVNALREFRGQGVQVWGARTQVAPSNKAWRYVPVRRLFNAVERDARAAMQTAVFEPNNAPTWESIRGALNNYLYALWRQGALQGDTPEQAYFVQVGLGTTMTQADIDNGNMVVKVGLAAVRPAEFIILELTQHVVPA